MIAVRTNNPKAIDETIRKVNLQLETDPHAAPYFPVQTGPGEGSGEFMKWVPFMQDPCPDMMAVKDEVRRAICAFFGIPPMVESDTAASGGLNDEGHQITLLNRRTQREQAPFNNKAFPWLCKQFGITDLKLVLNKSEKADEKADAELLLLDDQHARNLYDMGFDVWIEGGKWKHSDRPSEKRQPQVFQPPPRTGAMDMAASDVGTHRPGSGVPSDKGERCPGGQHSHPDYGDGRCHPEEQQHRDGEHREERGGRRESREERYEEASEERRTAAIKSIEARGVMVVEKESAHHKVLENIDAGFEESSKHGAPLPKSVMFDASFAENAGKILNIPAAYDREDDVLHVNPRSRFFQAGMMRASNFIQGGGGETYFSTGSILHIVRHELSHCAHWHHDQRSYRVKDFEDPSHRELAMSQVSTYAGEDPQEFVAETRAALLDGKKFSDDVMKLYEHYSGGLTR